MSEQIEEIANFWSQSPETYANVHGGTQYGDREVEIGSAEFFAQVDANFLRSVPELHAIPA